MPKGKLETETDLFEGVEERTVSISLLAETYTELEELCQKNAWGIEEGLLIVLMNGLAGLTNKYELTSHSTQQGITNLEEAVQELNQYRAMYSVMKFKAFQLLQIARTLEMNVAALRNANRGLKGTVQRLRRENKRLKEQASPKRRCDERSVS